MKDITDKAKAFCEEYVKNGFNARKAYMKIYGQEDGIKASSSAFQLLRDPRVIGYVSELEGNFKLSGYRAGVNKDTLIRVIADMLNATKTDIKGNQVPDWGARHNAVMSYAKLTGDLVEKKQTIPLDNEDDAGDKLKEMSFTELLAKRKEIMSNL